MPAPPEVLALIQRFHTQIAATKRGHVRTALERQIAATDRQIGHLVYQLYGLTDVEIALVEGAAK
jgi:hypothetical protein